MLLVVFYVVLIGLVAMPFVDHFEPSRQLITAHTTTGEPSLSLQVELLKVTA